MKTTNIFTGLFLVAFAAVAAAPPAQAFPPLGVPATIDPGLLNSNSAAPNIVFFAFADSAHTDVLTLDEFDGTQSLITRRVLAVTPSISVSFLVRKASVWMT